MRRLIASVLVMLAGCATPADVVITDKATGASGITAINARWQAGPLYLVFDGDLYQGVWTSIPDPAPLEGPVEGNSIFSGGPPQPVAGTAFASFRNISGKELRCEYRYRRSGLLRTNVTGAGECHDDSGHTYDLQLAGRPLDWLPN